MDYFKPSINNSKKNIISFFEDFNKIMKNNRNVNLESLTNNIIDHSEKLTLKSCKTNAGCEIDKFNLYYEFYILLNLIGLINYKMELDNATVFYQKKRLIDSIKKIKEKMDDHYHKAYNNEVNLVQVITNKIEKELYKIIKDTPLAKRSQKAPIIFKMFIEKFIEDFSKFNKDKYEVLKQKIQKIQEKKENSSNIEYYIVNLITINKYDHNYFLNFSIETIKYVNPKYQLLDSDGKILIANENLHNKIKNVNPSNDSIISVDYSKNVEVKIVEINEQYGGKKSKKRIYKKKGGEDSPIPLPQIFQPEDLMKGMPNLKLEGYDSVNDEMSGGKRFKKNNGSSNKKKSVKGGFNFLKTYSVDYYENGFFTDIKKIIEWCDHGKKDNNKPTKEIDKMKTIASQGLKQCEDIRGQPSTDEIVFKHYQCEIKKFIMYNLLLKLWKEHHIDEYINTDKLKKKLRRHTGPHGDKNPAIKYNKNFNSDNTINNSTLNNNNKFFKIDEKFFYNEDLLELVKIFENSDIRIFYKNNSNDNFSKIEYKSLVSKNGKVTTIKKKYRYQTLKNNKSVGGKKAAPKKKPVAKKPIKKVAPKKKPVTKNPVKKATPKKKPVTKKPVKKAAPKKTPVVKKPVKKAAPKKNPVVKKPVKKAAPKKKPATKKTVKK